MTNISKISKGQSLGISFTRREASVDQLNTVIDKVNNLDDSVTAIEAGTVSLSVVEAGNGTAAAPSLTFASDLDSGIYRVGANDIGIATNGTLAVDVSATVVTSALPVIVTDATDSTVSTTGSIKTAGGLGVAKALYVGTSVNAATYVTSGNGSVSLPAIGPVSDPDSGLYVIGANNLGIALGGAKVLDMRTTGLEIVGRVVKRPATTTVAANSGVTLTAAMMLSGYVEVTGTSGSLALDSVANVVTALGTAIPGLSFEFIINTKGATPMTATNVVTLTTPASTIFMKQFNTTDVGSAFIPTVTATDGIHIGHFRYTFQTATTAIVQRIG